VEKIGSHEIICSVGPKAELVQETQVWVAYHVSTNDSLPSQWAHEVSGNGIDKGMMYRYFWHELTSDDSKFHVYFRSVLDMVRKYISQ